MINSLFPKKGDDMHSIALNKEKISSWIRFLVTMLVASGFMALCAQIRIHLPFSPVPFTGQILGMGLIGAFLGRVQGALAIVFYLLEGMMGLPVFSGGNAGLLYLFGPVGGYLLSFPIGAYLIGWVREKLVSKNLLKITFFVFLATQAVLALGTLWLARFVGWDKALWLGWIPFLPFDVIKCYGIAWYIQFWRKRDCAKS